MKLKEIRIINEWDDEDDDLSPAERALIAKADKDLAKRGVKVKDFDPDKMVGKTKEKDEGDGGDEERSPSKPAKAKTTKKSVEKQPNPEKGKEETTPTKARGEKAVQARKFMQDNPNATRKQFTEFMSKHGVSPAYANTMFYAMKKKLQEVFYITNDKDQVLAEGDVWTIFEDYTKRLQMFRSEWNAKKKALKTGGNVKTFSTKNME